MLTEEKLTKNLNCALINSELTLAINNGSVEEVKRVLEQGADANYCDGDIVAMAICTKNVEVFKLLVEYGADPSRLTQYEHLSKEEAIRKIKFDVLT